MFGDSRTDLICIDAKSLAHRNSGNMRLALVELEPTTVSTSGCFIIRHKRRSPHQEEWGFVWISLELPGHNATRERSLCLSHQFERDPRCAGFAENRHGIRRRSLHATR